MYGQSQVDLFGLFQPTLPVRGVTFSSMSTPWTDEISTHTPRAGSDFIVCPFIDNLTLFQPTLPVRGVTYFDFLNLDLPYDFNPHSPCGE